MPIVPAEALRALRELVASAAAPPRTEGELRELVTQAGREDLLAIIVPGRTLSLIGMSQRNVGDVISERAGTLRPESLVVDDPVRDVRVPGPVDLGGAEGRAALSVAHRQFKALTRRTRLGIAPRGIADRVGLVPVQGHVCGRGDTHVRFTRVFRDSDGNALPIFGEQVVFHMDDANRALAPTGDVAPSPALLDALEVCAHASDAPSMTAAQAQGIALDTFRSQFEASEDVRLESPRKVIYPDRAGALHEAFICSVVDFSARRHGHLHPTALTVVVDARTGVVLDRWNEICHTPGATGSAGSDRPRPVGRPTLTRVVEPNVPIPDDGATPWVDLSVPSEGAVGRVVLDFGDAATPGIAHSWPRALAVDVRSPSGEVFSLPIRDTGFDDAKAVFGSFELPEAMGQSAHGTWSVRVRDRDAFGDSGTFHRVGFSVEVAGKYQRALEVHAAVDDLHPVETTLQLGPEAFVVSDVRLDLELEHADTADLTIDLMAPDGTTHQVHKRFPRGEDGKRLFSGQIDVTDLFAGKAGDGAWSLRVIDHAAGDGGELLRWGIEATPYVEPEPPEPGRDDLTSFYGHVSVATTKDGDRYRLADGIVETRDAKGQNPNDVAGKWDTGVAIEDADDRWVEPSLRTAVDAHYAALAMRDFMLEVLGRNSIDDNGMPIRSLANVGEDYVNAFWFRDLMHYGNGDGTTSGPLTTLDVGGHEISHGITEKSAGLVYRNESGGLNEATSDIFGTALEWFVSKRNPNVTFDWMIARETWTPKGPHDDALRYMDDPTRDGRGSIDHYSAYVDEMDVHFSSGIANNFFYLLVEGGTNKTSGMQVEGLKAAEGGGADGLDAAMRKALRIWYRALTAYMTPSTTFAQAREATERAAKDLFGADSAALAMVQKAWEAVGVKAPEVARHALVG